jgi:hypothetical protein
LTPGNYVLVVRGPAGLSGCASPYENEAFSVRTIFVSLSSDGSGWVVRALPSGGDVELRLSETALDSLQNGATGTIQGTVIAAHGSGNTVDIGVRFGAATAVSGSILLIAHRGSGTINGGATFIDTQRPTMICPSATWILFPNPI